MTQTQLSKAAFIRGADFAALYLGQNLPLHLIEEAFELWLAEQDEPNPDDEPEIQDWDNP